LRVLGVVR